jgi:enamine deaminase RidA (YjgF/YER057c/UK114 family)
MTTAIERLREYGYELPAAKAPVASYVPITRAGNLIYVSGQISTGENGVVTGRLGDNMNVVQGANAAELAALNVLAQLVHTAGLDLDGNLRVLKLTAFVASTPEFTEHHLVANGGSDLIVRALGDKGRHARVAIGVAALPLGAAVEIEALVEAG